MTPYSTGAVTKKRRGKGAADNDADELGEDEEGLPLEESEEDDDLELDTMIKVNLLHGGYFTQTIDFNKRFKRAGLVGPMSV